MSVEECYRVLELSVGADSEQVKASYRRLARQYHPDINPRQDALAHFITLTDAYKFLMKCVGSRPPATKYDRTAPRAGATSQGRVRVEREAPTEPASTATSPAAPHQGNSTTSQPLSDLDRHLKRQSYQQLHVLLKEQRFIRAITLVESLARRLPEDREVRQWQAIAYHLHGRDLAASHQTDKARIYLKKALQSDPHNRLLWTEVEQDFRFLEEQI
ncbi:DnaJ-class molecular chaperone with C-terminal Zn finger domain protein [Rubidibacter lacunae KORDI 51-2]|uniref:DnaJ-class molecular chaperone with C-terminal Zn finger domain protein n=2 Tax=Rubidibacter TaxID=582491 RepID=U5DJL7_9CHRO|nr:DnaJ-class molecular chaperone with C-terminal Zn finger domain protein [Rubidibacter lacunae KORDI 51-2]